MPTPPTDSFDMSTATPVAAGSLVSADRIGIVDMSGPTPVVATLGEFIKFYISPVSGIVKSNGSTLSAAVAGTDYLAPTGSGAGLTGITVSQVSGALAAANNLSDVADGPAAAANLGLGTGDDVTFQSVTSTFSGDGSGLTGLNPGSLSGPVGVGFGGLGASNAASTGVPLFTAGVVTIVATSGTGNFIRATSPTLVTPALGTPSALILTNATGLPIGGLSATGTPSSSTFLRGDNTWATPSGGGNVSNTGTPTSGQIAEWTSSTVIQGVAVTGTGSVVRASSPTLTTPALGTPSAVVLTNATGLPVGGISATGTPSGSTFLRGDGAWATPAGSGNVSTSGTITKDDFPRWASSTELVSRSASQFRGDIGLGSIATQAANAVTITGGSVGGCQLFLRAVTPGSPGEGEIWQDAGEVLALLDGTPTALLSAANSLAEIGAYGTTATARDNLSLGTANAPQFFGVNVGHATDTTVTRASAGDIAVEGNVVYRAGGTDVPVTDGGTGRSTGGTAYCLIATGTTATGAQQTLANGATTEILVGGGASALPVWTTATGSGSPVRGSGPTIAGGTHTALTGFSLRSTGAAFDLTLATSEVLTAGRTLSIVMGDAARTLTFAGNATISGTNTGDQTSVTGNAGTATALQTARNINGVSFNGTADITVAAAAGTLTGTTMAANVVTSSLTTVGTIGAGVWQGTAVGVAYGGSGATTAVGARAAYGFVTLTTTATSGTVTIDCSAADITYVLSLTNNVTLALSNEADGRRFTLFVRGQASGYTITWWASIKWPGGAAPTIPTTSGRVLPISFIRLASGEWLGIPGTECY